MNFTGQALMVIQVSSLAFVETLCNVVHRFCSHKNLEERFHLEPASGKSAQVSCRSSHKSVLTCFTKVPVSNFQVILLTDASPHRATQPATELTPQTRGEHSLHFCTKTYRKIVCKLLPFNTVFCNSSCLILRKKTEVEAKDKALTWHRYLGIIQVTF